MPSRTQYSSMINHHAAHDSHRGVQELIHCPLRHLIPIIVFMLPFRQRKVWRDRFPEISQNHAFNTIFLWCTYPKPNKISMSRWYEIPMLCWILSRSCTAMLATFVPWPQFRNAETVQRAKCVTRIGESKSSAWSFEFLLLKTFQINGFQVVPVGWNRGKKTRGANWMVQVQVLTLERRAVIAPYKTPCLTVRCQVWKMWTNI